MLDKGLTVILGTRKRRTGVGPGLCKGAPWGPGVAPRRPCHPTRFLREKFSPWVPSPGGLDFPRTCRDCNFEKISGRGILTRGVGVPSPDLPPGAGRGARVPEGAGGGSRAEGQRSPMTGQVAVAVAPGRGGGEGRAGRGGLAGLQGQGTVHGRIRSGRCWLSGYVR